MVKSRTGSPTRHPARRSRANGPSPDRAVADRPVADRPAHDRHAAVRPAADRPGPARLAAADRRAQILAAVLPVFARLGLAGASTRQLADAAGVSEPILYRHFRGKDELFAAVLDEVGERLAAALRAVLAGDRPLPRRLAAVAAGLPAIVARHEDDLRVLCGAAANHGDLEVRATRQCLLRIGGELRDGLGGAGLRRGVDAETAAFFLLQIGLGSVLLRPVGVHEVLRKGFPARAATLVQGALLRDPR